MSTKNTSMKGKRYTDEQKQEVVQFVEKHNQENGRGGQSAASSKFGVSQLTISGWLKGSGSPAASKKAKGAKAPKAAKAAKAPKAAKASKAAKVAEAPQSAEAPAPARRGRPKGSRNGSTSSAASTGGGFSAKLNRLVELDKQIQKTSKELDQLRANFNAIKASL
jgi:transposase-like protein